jgi:hypothetical protein
MRRGGMRWVRTLGLLALVGCGATEHEPSPPVLVAEVPASDSPSAQEPREEAPGSPCVPVSCRGAGKDCGQIPDGCGGTLECGPCGGGNTSEPEPPPVCIPDSCGARGAQCGDYPDGCGGTLHCGTCPTGEVCGLFFAGQCDPSSIDKSLGSAVPLHHTGCPGRHSVEDSTVLSILAWTAPHTGAFVISNAGSEAEVWMTVSAVPGWEEPMPGQTRAHPHRYDLEKGQRVFIWLWGRMNPFGGEADYQLRISEWVPDERGRCGNRTDDDGDGTVDCWDPDCEETPECQRGSACADDDLGSALPAFGRGATRDTPHFFETSCGVQGRNERVHVWTAPRAGRFVFQPDEYGSVISARSGCRGEELACAVSNDWNSPSDKQAVLVREMAAGESILLVLEGWRSLEHFPMPTPSGVFVHEWVPDEGAGLCGDGRDNDADGYVDAMDPGCPNYGQW